MIPSWIAGGSWLAAFLVTQIIETPVYAWALHARFRLLEALALGFLASCLTHPLLFLALHPALKVFDLGTFALIPLEGFAILVEALYLRILRLPRAFLWALFANTLSAGLGLLSRSLFFWP